jgi:(R,R)-butanediol dehydrogenase/meso-butanediol dehydrogenase/diacetyl reductase
MGADEVWSFDEEKMQRLPEFFGSPPDIVAECVGKPGFVNQAISYARREGTVISMGMCMQTDPVLPAACAFREVRLFFPLGYSTSEFAATARAFDSGRVQPDIMVSDVIALEEIGTTMDELRAGRKSLKVQVDPCREHHHA